MFVWLVVLSTMLKTFSLKRVCYTIHYPDAHNGSHLQQPETASSAMYLQRCAFVIDYNSLAGMVIFALASLAIWNYIQISTKATTSCARKTSRDLLGDTHRPTSHISHTHRHFMTHSTRGKR